MLCNNVITKADLVCNEWCINMMKKIRWKSFARGKYGQLYTKYIARKVTLSKSVCKVTVHLHLLLQCCLSLTDVGIDACGLKTSLHMPLFISEHVPLDKWLNFINVFGTDISPVYDSYFHTPLLSVY